MSLKERKPKREAALQFAQVVSRNAAGKATAVRVPGSKGKSYKVIIRRQCNLSVECLCETNIGHTPCQGNSHNTICYHAQAAIMLACQDTKGKVAWCETLEDADRLSHINKGMIIPVTSRQGKGQAYIVYTKEK